MKTPFDLVIAPTGTRLNTSHRPALSNKGHVRIGLKKSRHAPGGDPFPDIEAAFALCVTAADKTGIQPEQVTS